MTAAAQLASNGTADSTAGDFRRRLSNLLACLGGAVALLLAACSPPAQRAVGTSGQEVYVLNGLDRTISRLESTSGQVVGQPLSAGGVPSQVVAAGDAFVVLATDERGHEPRLVSFIRRGSGWATRTPPIEPGAEDVLLAGAGPRHAVAAYRLNAPVAGAPVAIAPVPDGRGAEAGPCRLVVLDLGAGTVTTSTLANATCGGGDSIRSLAAEQGAAGIVAFLGVWRWPADAADRAAFGNGRVARVEVTVSGITAQSALPLAGAAERLVLGAAPERAGRRLYALEMVPGPQHAGWALARGEEYQPAQAWRFLGLDPDTLRSETVIPLLKPPVALAPAPDGRRVYGLVPLEGPPPSTDLLELDLATGSARHLATLAGLSLGIAATADRVFATRSDGEQVWALDVRDGRLVRTVAVGRHPIGVAASGG